MLARIPTLHLMIREVFDALDVNGDGALELHEMVPTLTLNRTESLAPTVASAP